MELGQLYQFVLMLVLIGMIVGVGIVSLDKFQAVDGLSVTAKTAIGNTTTAIAAIPTSWLSLIVTIVILAIIVVIMVRSFAGIGQR
jgi:MFS superfamily sulfate permease-like transporter